MLATLTHEENTIMATKHIIPEAGGFAAFVDDQRIGWRGTEPEACELANEYIYDAEQSGALYCPAAAEKAVAITLVDEPPITQPDAEYISLEDAIDSLPPRNMRAVQEAAIAFAELDTRIAFLCGKLSRQVCDSRDLARAQHVVALLEALTENVPADAVRTVPAYRLPNGDFTSDPVGPLAFVDFEIGDGAAKVSLGPREGYPGLDLTIGGRMINTRVTEVITLADVRQLRDNLTALLADKRLLAAFGKPITSPPAAPTALTVRKVPCICDDKHDPRYGTVAWMNYIVDTPVGPVEAAVSDHWPPELGTDKCDLGPLADWVHLVPAITALMSHPDVQAALVRHTTSAPPKPIPPAPAIVIKRHDDEGMHCTDFRCGDVVVEVPDAPDEEIAIYGLSCDQQPIADAERNIIYLATILHDPRFQAARKAA